MRTIGMAPRGGRAHRAGNQDASVNGWKESLTIPAEYYIEPKHFEADEAFVGENFWQYTDQASRILPPPPLSL